MSVTTDQKIAAAYVAFFKRAPDQNGLEFWRAEATNSGLSDLDLLKSLASGFAQHPSFAATYGGLSNSVFINAIYQNVGGSPADAAGHAFWLEQLENGLSRSDFVASFVYGLLEITVDTLDSLLESGEINLQEYSLALARKNNLMNQSEVALAFTNALGNASNLAPSTNPLDPQDLAEDRAYLASVAIISGVNDTAASKYLPLGLLETTPTVREILDTFASEGGVVERFFTLAALPSQTTTTVQWNGVDVDVALDFFQTVLGLDLNQLGWMQDGKLIVNIGNITVSDTTNGAEVYIDVLNGEGLALSLTTPLALYTQIIFGLEQYDTTTTSAIQLTPTANNGGTYEVGVTAGQVNDTIYAGRPELLHGAYIDGGPGYNTLVVDMKGPFAQPLQLLNIQEVQVQNLPNVYAAVYPDNYVSPIGGVFGDYDSSLDLSRARSLEKLVITEGQFSASLGDLYITGVQNYATLRLEGGFTQDVNVFYGVGQGSLLNVELANVLFTSGDFNLGHNAGAVSISSEGRLNVLDEVHFGDYLRELYVTGAGELVIHSDVNFAFGEAYIDASAATGGLRVSVSSLGELLESVTIKGSQGRDVVEVSDTAEGVLLDIDLGAGADTLILDDVVAGFHSTITGNGLVIKVEGETKLDLATIVPTGLTHILIANGADLTLTQAQVTAIGATKFLPEHAHNSALLKIIVTEDSNLSDILDLAALNPKVKLYLEVKQGVTLTLTAEELHKYLAEDGIVLGNGAGESQGKIVVTDAGLGFVLDDTSTYADGGTINPGNAPDNVTVVRAIDGYERPVRDDYVDTLTIDSTGTTGVVVEANDIPGTPDDTAAFSLNVHTLILTGDADITFNAPVEFLSPNFVIDFSGLTGDLNGLFIKDFHEITEAGAIADQGQIIGNPAISARIDVELSGGEVVGAPGNGNGLRSTGVATYVVHTGNTIENEFYVCDLTVGLQTLGLQGQGEVIFNQINWGVSLLLEGDGYQNFANVPKANGNPDESNIGSLEANYFWPGADVVVEINNQGQALGVTSTGAARPLVVESLQINNAARVTVNVEDGNAVIEQLTGDGIEDVVLSSAFDVTLQLGNGDLPELESIDAAGVDGVATLYLEPGANFDLSDVELSGIEALVLGNGSTATLNIDQIIAIGVDNIRVENDGDTATLNVGNYAGEAFDFSALELDDITVASVTFVAGETLVVDAATDFTGVGTLIVPANTHVTLSAAQFKQLVESGATIVTQDLLGDPDTLGSLTVDLDGDLTIGVDDETTIAGANVIFDMADAETLNVEILSLANGLQVNGDAAAATKPLVNFTFVSDLVPGTTSAPFSSTIDVEAYKDVDLRIPDLLLNNFEILGGNSQSIEDLLENLENAAILNIYWDVTAPVELDPRDRVVVVEPTASPNGIEFSAVGSIVDYVRSINLTLQSTADDSARVGGDIYVNDAEVRAGYTTLTINTTGVGGPVVIDGDILTDGVAAAGNAGDLLTVTINAAVDLEVTGTIVFNATEADSTATLRVTGAADVTIKALDTTDGDITSLVVDTTGYTGTLTITGGSDALEVNSTTSLVFVGSGDVVLDTDDGLGNNGIEGDDLTSIDASGLTGSLTVGVIEDVQEDSFTFTAAQGVTTLTMGAGTVLDVDGDDEAAGWVFNLNANSTLTIDDAVFAEGPLTITNGTVVLQGVVDLRNLVDGDGNSLLTIGDDVVFSLAPGAALLLTDAQWEALPADVQAAITGAGQTLDLSDLDVVTDLAAAGVIGDLTEVRGVTELIVPQAGLTALTLTSAQAKVAYLVDGDGDRVLWNHDGDALTDDVEVEDGNLSLYAGLVTVEVSSNDDLTGLLLANDDTILVKFESLPQLTLTDAQVEILAVETDALGATSTDGDDIYDALASLTVKVAYEGLTFEGDTVDSVADVSFSITRNGDGDVTAVAVSGLAGAIGQSDVVASTFADLLDEATSITWTGVGSLFSADNDPLNARDGAVDTFRWVSTTNNSEPTDIVNFTGGAGTVNVPADVLDFSSFLGTVAGLEAFNLDPILSEVVDSGSVVLVQGPFADAASLATALTVGGGYENIDAAADGKYVFLTAGDIASTGTYNVFYATGALLGEFEGITLMGTVTVDEAALVAGNFGIA